MLDKLRVHYKFKFLLKVKNSRTGWEISKVAPVFTQLGLEDGSNVDDLVKEFFNVYFGHPNLNWQFLEFYIVLDMIIWRSTNLNTTFYIKPWTMRSFIFAYLLTTHKIDFSLFYIEPTSELGVTFPLWLKKQSALYSLSLYFGVGVFWSPEWGYRWRSNQFKAMRHTLRNTFLTYLKHFQMLGRKINFRRKILKKKFEEYT